MGSSSGRGRDIEMSEIERERERLLQTEPPSVAICIFYVLINWAVLVPLFCCSRICCHSDWSR